jgi:hypothetical protein
MAGTQQHLFHRKRELRQRDRDQYDGVVSGDEMKLKIKNGRDGTPMVTTVAKYHQPVSQSTNRMAGSVQEQAAAFLLFQVE